MAAEKDKQVQDVAALLCRTDCQMTDNDCVGCVDSGSRAMYVPQAEALVNAGAIAPGWSLPVLQAAAE